jgi:hypothetical protein
MPVCHISKPFIGRVRSLEDVVCHHPPREGEGERIEKTSPLYILLSIHLNFTSLEWFRVPTPTFITNVYRSRNTWALHNKQRPYPPLVGATKHCPAPPLWSRFGRTNPYTRSLLDAQTPTSKEPIYMFFRPNLAIQIWANQPKHSFLVGCLYPYLQGTNIHVVSPQPFNPYLGEPTHTLVPCWMPKPLPPRNQYTCCFVPTLQSRFGRTNPYTRSSLDV